MVNISIHFDKVYELEFFELTQFEQHIVCAYADEFYGISHRLAHHNFRMKQIQLSVRRRAFSAINCKQIVFVNK